LRRAPATPCGFCDPATGEIGQKSAIGTAAKPPQRDLRYRLALGARSVKQSHACNLAIRANVSGAEVIHLDTEFIRDLFAPFGPVSVRRMFGGAGIWSEGLMFALVFDGAIFLKVDEESIPDFEREGSKPFVYTRAKSRGRVGRASLSYWRLPERLYDDPEELVAWANRALAIAQRKKFKKLAPRRQVKRKRPSERAQPAPRRETRRQK
jgi:DNA transformation protein and related proteins